MLTLGTLFGTAFAFSGGNKKPAATPPLNASSSDEADFITGHELVVDGGLTLRT